MKVTRFSMNGGVVIQVDEPEESEQKLESALNSPAPFLGITYTHYPRAEPGQQQIIKLKQFLNKAFIIEMDLLEVSSLDITTPPPPNLRMH